MNQQRYGYMYKIIAYLPYTALYNLLTTLYYSTEAVFNNCVNSLANNIFLLNNNTTTSLDCRLFQHNLQIMNLFTDMCNVLKKMM